MLDRLKGVLLLLPLLFVLILGGELLYITATILSIVSLYELYKGFHKKGFEPMLETGIATCILSLGQTLLNLPVHIIAILYLCLFIYTAGRIILNQRNIIDLCITIFGIIYIIIPFGCIIQIYNTSPTNTINFSWLIFLIAFSSDICAYCTGKMIGKHKLIPEISPNKTIEGSLGAILGSIFITVLFGPVFNLHLWQSIIIGLAGSSVAQIGDLFASSIKRYLGLKDFSNLIPGHGGVIDRFDSILFVAPMVLTVVYFILI